MIRFFADHCFDEDLLRAVKRRNRALEFVLARKVGLAEAADSEIIAWAAKEGLVVITHDRNTMIATAIDRIERREPMAGLVVVSRLEPFTVLIEDILILAECTQTVEWQDHIEFVPL